MQLNLDGKQVVVTGAGGGIGQALVAAFRSAGARVAGADRTTLTMEAIDVDARLAFDIADPAAAAAAATDHLAAAGCPDIVVSNAGHTRAELLEQADQAAWDAELAVNLTGAVAFTRPLIEAMAARGSGTLVFVSSVNALAHFGNPAYSAAKAGLVAYAKAVAVERGRFGIRSNVVCPGSVRTPAWDHRFARDPGLMGKVLPHYPLGRLVTAAEVAQTVLFLASPLASGITGAVVPVDAGLMAGNSRFVADVIEGR